MPNKLKPKISYSFRCINCGRNVKRVLCEFNYKTKCCDTCLDAHRPSQEDLTEAMELLGESNDMLTGIVKGLNRHAADHFKGATSEINKTTSKLQSFLSKRQGGS